MWSRRSSAYFSLRSLASASVGFSLPCSLAGTHRHCSSSADSDDSLPQRRRRVPLKVRPSAPVDPEEQPIITTSTRSSFEPRDNSDALYGEHTRRSVSSQGSTFGGLTSASAVDDDERPQQPQRRVASVSNVSLENMATLEDDELNRLWAEADTQPAPGSCEAFLAEADEAEQLSDVLTIMETGESEERKQGRQTRRANNKARIGTTRSEVLVKFSGFQNKAYPVMPAYFPQPLRNEGPGEHNRIRIRVRLPEALKRAARGDRSFIDGDTVTDDLVPILKAPNRDGSKGGVQQQDERGWGSQWGEEEGGGRRSRRGRGRGRRSEEEDEDPVPRGRGGARFAKQQPRTPPRVEFEGDNSDAIAAATAEVAGAEAATSVGAVFRHAGSPRAEPRTMRQPPTPPERQRGPWRDAYGNVVGATADDDEIEGHVEDYIAANSHRLNAARWRSDEEKGSYSPSQDREAWGDHRSEPQQPQQQRPSAWETAGGSSVNGPIGTPRAAASGGRRRPVAFTPGEAGSMEDVLASEASFATTAARQHVADGARHRQRPRYPPGMDDLSDVLESEAELLGSNRGGTATSGRVPRMTRGRGGGGMRRTHAVGAQATRNDVPGQPAQRQHSTSAAFSTSKFATGGSGIRRVDQADRPNDNRGVRVVGVAAGARVEDVPSAFRGGRSCSDKLPPLKLAGRATTAAAATEKRRRDRDNDAAVAPAPSPYRWATLTAAVADEVLPQARSALNLIGASDNAAVPREAQLHALVSAVLRAADSSSSSSSGVDNTAMDSVDSCEEAQYIGYVSSSSPIAHVEDGFDTSDDNGTFDPNAALLRDKHATTVCAAGLLALLADAMVADAPHNGSGSIDRINGLHDFAAPAALDDAAVGTLPSASSSSSAARSAAIPRRPVHPSRLGVTAASTAGDAEPAADVAEKTWGPVPLALLHLAIRPAHGDPSAPSTAISTCSPLELARAAVRDDGVTSSPVGLPPTAAALLSRELAPRGGLHAFFGRGGPMGNVARLVTAAAPTSPTATTTASCTVVSLAIEGTRCASDDNPSPASSSGGCDTLSVSLVVADGKPSDAAVAPWRSSVAPPSLARFDDSGDEDGAASQGRGTSRTSYLARRLQQDPPPLNSADVGAVFDLLATPRVTYGDRFHFSAHEAIRDASERGVAVTTFFDDARCGTVAAFRRHTDEEKQKKKPDGVGVSAEEHPQHRHDDEGDALYVGAPPSELAHTRGFTSREVADWYTPFVPTFFVDEKILFRTLPPPVGADAMGASFRRGGYDRYFRPSAFFSKYPEVFDVRGSSAHERKVVRLARTLRHPRRGQADRLFTHLAPEGLEEERAREIDNAFLAVLVKNLPRTSSASPAATDERGFVPLVDWINTFPPEDLRVLNSEPPLRVLQVLRRNAGTFQLSPHRAASLSSSLSPHLLESAAAARDGDGDLDGGRDHDDTAGDGSAPGAAPPASFDVVVRARPPHIAPRSTSEYTVATSPCPALAAAILRIMAELSGEQRFAAEEAALVAEEERLSSSPLVSDNEGSEADAWGDASAGAEHRHQEDEQHHDNGNGSNCANDDDDDNKAVHAETVAPAPNQGAKRPRRSVFVGSMDAISADWLPPAPKLSDVLLETQWEGDGSSKKAVQKRNRRQNDEDANGDDADDCDEDDAMYEGEFSAAGVEATVADEWVALKDVYAHLGPGERRLLRPFHTLANFAAQHGRIVEVSADRQFVIRHTASLSARPPPPPCLQDTMGGGGVDRMRPDKVFDESDDDSLYSGTARASGGARRTPYVVATAPEDRAKLIAAIAAALPDHPVTLTELKRRLPRAVLARLPVRLPQMLAGAKKHLTVWRDQHQHNILMIQRASLGPAPAGLGLKDVLDTPEECVDATLGLIFDERRRQAALGTPDAEARGLTFEGLRSRASPGLRNGWRRHHGGLDEFVDAYPQFFSVDSAGRKSIVHALVGDPAASSASDIFDGDDGTDDHDDVTHATATSSRYGAYGYAPEEAAATDTLPDNNAGDADAFHLYEESDVDPPTPHSVSN